MKRRIVYIIVGIIILILVGVFNAQRNIYELTELGVAIKTSDELEDLEYVASEQPFGTVLFMRAGEVIVNGAPCTLGAFYMIQKNNVATTTGMMWNEESLKAATVDRNGTPAQVKEFDDSYLVFEPTQSACALDGDTETLKKEGEKRLALWKSVTTAKIKK
jgi:hypothetical protein